jgi:autotransporter-associated beta strand protein
MNNRISRNHVSIALAISVVFMTAAAQFAGAVGTITWSGGGGANQNWSLGANWSGGTSPGAGDTAFFRSTGAVGSAGTVNNIVDASFTAALGSLIFTNESANLFHTTQIPSGNTLTVSGVIFVGGTNQTATYTLTGGGALRGGTGTSAFTVATANGGTLTLDMSPLSNFVYNAGGSGGTFAVGLDAGVSSGGILKLAAVSNNITATTMIVGNNNSSGTSTLNLGAGTNIINANTLNVSFDKSQGTVQFNSSSGGLRLRNAAGTGRTTLSVAGNGHSGSSSATTTGNISLKGHPVDMLIGTLTLANRVARSGGSDNAFFAFDTGVVDVGTLNMAINSSGGTAPIGVMSVGGGTLKVGSISLVNCGGTGGTGSLIITNGGLVICSNSILKTTAVGTGVISITNATLTMTSGTGSIGVSGQAVDTINLSSATLHLKVDANATGPNIVATTINTNGVNPIIIDAIANVSGTMTLPLISYTGADPFGSLTLSLPLGFSGNLEDDVANSMIKVTITAPVSAALVWVGATNSVLISNWDTNKTKNWVDAATLSISQAYADPDTVLFDDTALNSTVTLMTANLPASVNFNNSTLSYTLNGQGKISGSTSLTNLNSGTVLLSEAGGDDFSGGVYVNAGTVILDQTNSAISGGLTIASGATAQIGNNDGGGNLPSGALDDEGALIVKRSNAFSISTAINGAGSLSQNGNGVLTLSVSNGYSGSTIVSKGTLALSGSGSIIPSSSLLVSNGTFDVSALPTRTTLLNDLNLTNATLNVAPTNLQVPISTVSFEADGIVARSNIINVLALPPIASYPTTIPLVQSAGAISLAGGNFNFALGTLPAGSPPYAGAISESADNTAIMLTLTAGPIGARATVTWAGTNNVSANTNWSSGFNWQLPGVPLTTDNLFFDGNTTVADGLTINNVVDTSTTVAGLTYNHTNSQYQVTQIPAGNTLTVNNTFTVGNLTVDGAVTRTVFTDGGTLVVNATNPNIVGNSGSTSSSGNASLDLSGLSNFVYNASGSTFGVGNIGGRGIGTITLAGVSNSITASTVAIMTSSASSSVNGTSTLGAGTNIINANTINISATRASGTLRFDPANPNGGLRLRGTGGTDNDRATMTIGNRSSGGTSGTAAGTLALNDHPIDLKLGTLTLGECNQASPVAGTGTFQFNQGVVDVGGILMAINSSSGSATATFTAGGGTLIVGTGGISLVNQTGGAATGNLTFNNTAVTCSNSIVKTTSAGTANVTIGGGSLNMVSGVIGSLGAPIDSLTLNGGTTLQLNVIVGVTNIAATSITASGTTTINIDSLVGVAGTTQIPLISYANGVSPYANLALGTVPSGYIVGNGGLLVDNTANQSIDVIITPPAPIIWKGAVGSVLNSTWDTSTLNWLNGATPVAFANGNYVQFDDSASNNVATLAANVTPANITVDNNVLNYTFNGAGKVTGPVALIKQGSGLLVIDNSGSNDFTGGINISAGTLQLGNNDSNGNAPATGGIIDDGALIFKRTDSYTTPNVISGSGSVTQSGTGTNRLSGVNTYGGTTLISSGTIIVANASAGNSSLGAIPGGAVIITNGGTLDVGGSSTAQSLGFTNASGEAKQFYIAGSGIGGNGVIVNNGTVNQQNAFQLITLTADATIGGPTRWDMRGNASVTPVLDLRGHTLTKTGSNQMSMVNLQVTNGGNIIINSGTFSFETTSSNATTPITVNAGGVLGHFRENAGFFTAPITLNGGMIRDLNGTPGSTNDSPITLTANSYLDLNVGSADLVRLNGVISESGGSYGLTKTNVGSYALASVNTYSGTTLVAQGKLILANSGSISQSKLVTVASGATLDASQRDDGTLTLTANQTLSGFGTVTGIVNAVVGTVAPGLSSATGTLTFNNDVTLGGTNVMKLNKGGAANDSLFVSGALVLNGVLNITNLSGTLAASDTFKLYNVSGGISGAFSSVVPAIPAPGLAWNTNTLTTDGILRFTATVNTTPTNIVFAIVGNQLNLSWPADYTGWRLQVQTNSIITGLNSNWVDVPGSTSVNSVSFPISSSNGSVFFRMVYP